MKDDEAILYLFRNQMECVWLLVSYGSRTIMIFLFGWVNLELSILRAGLGWKSPVHVGLKICAHKSPMGVVEPRFLGQARALFGLHVLFYWKINEINYLGGLDRPNFFRAWNTLGSAGRVGGQNPLGLSSAWLKMQRSRWIVPTHPV